MSASPLCDLRVLSFPASAAKTSRQSSECNRSLWDQKPRLGLPQKKEVNEKGCDPYPCAVPTKRLL